LQATLLAMKRAVEGLPLMRSNTSPDGSAGGWLCMSPPKLSTKVAPLLKVIDWCEISAARILAKTSRAHAEMVMLHLNAISAIMDG
jgi:hypothetical protein